MPNEQFQESGPQKRNLTNPREPVINTTWESRELLMPSLKEERPASEVQSETRNPYTVDAGTANHHATGSINPVAKKNSILQAIESYRASSTPVVAAFNAAWAVAGTASILLTRQAIHGLLNNAQNGAINLNGIPVVPMVIVTTCLTAMWASSAVVLAERAYHRVTKSFK